MLVMIENTAVIMLLDMRVLFSVLFCFIFLFLFLCRDKFLIKMNKIL
jgi:hypothetical protein